MMPRFPASAPLLVLALVTSFGILGPPALAGNEKGNGGDAVVCREGDGSIRSVEFFDRFEAREVYGKSVELGGTKLSTAAKVELYAIRIERRFPKLAARFREFARTFFERALFAETALEDIPDSGEVIFPKGCAIEQVIIRGPIAHLPGKSFLIDSRLWERMDAENRAIAIAHEFLYGIAVDSYGRPTSSEARRLNAEFLSNPPPSQNDYFEWYELMRDLSLPLFKDEYWAGWVSVDRSYSPSREPPRRRTIRARTFGKTRLRSTTLGEVELAAGSDYVLTQVLPSGDVYLEGTLAGPHVFQTPYGDFSVEKGSFAETIPIAAGSGEAGIRINARGIRLPALPRFPFTYSASDECDRYEGSITIVNVWAKPERLLSVDLKASHPACTMRFGIDAFAATVESRGSFGFSTHGKPDRWENTRLRVKPSRLRWGYGEFTDFREAVSFSGKGIEASADDTIGVFPDLRVKGVRILDLRFTKIEFGAANRVESITPKVRDVPPARVIVRPGVELVGNIREEFKPSLVPETADRFRGIQGDFRISKLEGFSRVYLGLPVERLYTDGFCISTLPRARVADGDRFRTFGADPRSPIESIFRRDTSGCYPVPFAPQGSVRIAGEGGKNEIHIPIDVEFGSTIELTPLGMLHYRKRELLENLNRMRPDGKIEYRSIDLDAYLRPGGFFIDRIDENRRIL